MDGMRTDDTAIRAEAWVTAFGAAAGSGDAGAMARLLAPECHWRDVLALDWQIRTISGHDAIEAFLAERLLAAGLRGVRLAEGRTTPRRVERAGVPVVEALLAFETRAGVGDAVARLIEGEAGSGAGGLLGWTVLTTLEALHAPADPAGPDFARSFGGENWLDRRRRSTEYRDRDPEVVVIGAGQAGLSIAARLGALGIDTLVIDRHARVGDNWRKRYHALTLHNEVHVNHLPLMPFPPNWPTFIPKDKLAHWFEAYAESMELNVWTETTLEGGSHDGTDWTLALRRQGESRVMRPKHVVFATGVSGIPVMPNLPGLDTFAGTVMHSGAYTEGSAWRGKHALVIGTGNSAHDVAQDLHASGAAVTMVQRSPTYVVSLREAQRVYAIYGEGPPIEDCDLLALATPYPALVRAYQLSTALSKAADRALLEGLAARGFRLTFGEDETGFQMMYLRRGGGYYFNVGCSDLIVSGEIDLLHFGDIEWFVPEGARLADGRLVEADLVVLATGYESQQAVVRAALGDGIADRVGPVWGVDAGGELRNMWRRTAQPGLWFTAGSLAQCRIWSRYLALQIQADLIAWRDGPAKIHRASRPPPARAPYRR
ncbi:MAG: NAD(P)/FAD-dependent oxidoreductase [Acetobacteraceae bacterium]|nr:NAD(P)/FAD-dependent oxidoreductase [Acetobacteraceae bacterium]